MFWKSLLLLFSCVVALNQAQQWAQREDYDTTTNPELKAPNWMSYIEDDRSISTLSIPGTRASMSYGVGSRADTRTQSWSLNQQYEAGIRYVDIRCRHYGNNLYAYVHDGSSRSMYSLDSIITDTIRFLDAYPTETVLMRISREGIPAYNRETMADSLRRLLVGYPSYRIWSSARTPKMNDARGKIVILQDFYDPFQVGINYRYLNIEDSSNVRNQYAITWKWDRVRHHLYQAQRGGSQNVYITYTGGSGEGLAPAVVANRVNRKVWELIMQYDGSTHRWGIIAMDFPGSSLVRKIVDSNF